ncbi:ATP-binding cassette domain-containing protein [Candidatus Thorarchaeota archaeon]|nr:MAG: ATP-binding cassette domain-containing protein [Candidatus Thorarchaeota archaeon]
MDADTNILQRMTSNELVSMAVALDIPLTQRSIIRDELVDRIASELEKTEKKGLKPLTSPAIRIENMTKRFGPKVAVRDLNLKVNPGEIVGLVGPNGAGKTTTLRVLTGIIRPTSGSVHVNGHDMCKKPIPGKRVLGYIPERPTCYPSLKVREYLTFMARIYGVSKVNTILRIREQIDLFHLNEFVDSYIGTLSKGNLQRALLAGIFIRDPPYILAFDEPIYGLDPRGAWNLKSLLKRLKKEGSAILVSTHILEVAESLCDRFIIMNHGNVVGRGTLSKLSSLFDKATTLEEIFLMLTGGIPQT